MNAPIDTLCDRPVAKPRLELPPQVRDLAPREREIATLVYRLRSARAKDVEEYFSGYLTNASVRSMLMRLCKKGILKRRRVTLSKPRARRIAYLYMPAICADAVREGALRQLAVDHFGGSLNDVSNLVLDLLKDAGPSTSS